MLYAETIVCHPPRSILLSKTILVLGKDGQSSSARSLSRGKQNEHNIWENIMHTEFGIMILFASRRCQIVSGGIFHCQEVPLSDFFTQ